MVGRLVEEEDVRLLKKKPAKSDTSTLATRKGVNLLVVGRTLQGVHGALEFRVEVPCVGGIKLVLKFGLTGEEFVEVGVRFAESHVDGVVFGQHVDDGLDALADNFDNGLVGVELRFLLEITDRVSGRENDLSLIRLVYAGDDFQQGRFAGTVKTYDTNFSAIEEGKINVFKDGFLRRVGLGYAYHRENDFFVVGHWN